METFMQEHGYNSKSEFLRAAIREKLESSVHDKWSSISEKHIEHAFRNETVEQIMEVE